MIAVDTNILVYAHRSDSQFHAPGLRRLRELVEGNSAWGIPWPCVHEFLGIVTNRRIYQPPTSPDEALQYVDSLIQSPNLVLLSETDRHWQTLQALVRRAQILGGKVLDARIAAICIDHGVTELWSADRDFNRFPALKVVNPLVQ